MVTASALPTLAPITSRPDTTPFLTRMARELVAKYGPRATCRIWWW
ncbi:hypothetical protein MUN84_01875 [Hymenobacter sp. 5516J-16]|nr:hypothetical protein [Hymenobacter sp. 5516J-16]UOQ77482.1 hypothetical protein MUN84_01875 [Hymenobacter sp. 5516J-16]